MWFIRFPVLPPSRDCVTSVQEKSLVTSDSSGFTLEVDPGKDERGNECEDLSGVKQPGEEGEEKFAANVQAFNPNERQKNHPLTIAALLPPQNVSVSVSRGPQGRQGH